MRPGGAADHSPTPSAAVMEEGPHRACNVITLLTASYNQLMHKYDWTHIS